MASTENLRYNLFVLINTDNLLKTSNFNFIMKYLFYKQELLALFLTVYGSPFYLLLEQDKPSPTSRFSKRLGFPYT